MDKTLKKVMKIMFSIVFIFLGIMMLLYIYSQPCTVESLKTVQDGQVVAEVVFPKELQLLLCLQGSAEILILMIMGISLLFGGVGYLTKNIVGN